MLFKVFPGEVIFLLDINFDQKHIMLKISFKKILPGIIWLIIIVILLSLPGSAFPSKNWMSKIWLDKWVHIFLFGMLTILFCLPLLYNKEKLLLHSIMYIIVATLISIMVGVIMEFVQKYFIPNRSFEILDIAADSIGSIIGCVFCMQRYKKISPNRNWGRN